MKKIILLLFIMMLLTDTAFAGLHLWKTDIIDPNKLLEEIYDSPNNFFISTKYFGVGYKLKLPFGKVLTMIKKEEPFIGDVIYWFSYQTKTNETLKIPIRALEFSDSFAHAVISPGHAYTGCYTFVQPITAFMIDDYYVFCEYVYVKAQYGFWTTRFYIEEPKE